MKKDSKIYIAGHNGMVGSAIKRKLEADGYTNIIGRRSADLDLRDQKAVYDFFSAEKPEYVFLAAAKVGGVVANNTYRADFIYENLMIEANVIHAAYATGVTKLMFLGSSCIYPKLAPQPIKEEYLLTGLLEPTNEPYAIAKIAGINLCQSFRRQYGCNFISVMPTNLYGPNDTYDLEKSHVIPALLKKFYSAKKSGAAFVELWGTGAPRREFLHVDDMAAACIFLMETYDGEEHLNIGVGEDMTIKELGEVVKDVSGFDGELRFDTSKPDGMFRKLLDVSKLNNLGWKASIPFKEGLKAVYNEAAEKGLLD